MNGHHCKTCHVLTRALTCLTSEDVELSRFRMGAQGENQLLEARHWLEKYFTFHQKMHVHRKDVPTGDGQ